MAITVAYPAAYLEAIEQELRSCVQAAPLPLTAPLARDLVTLFEYHLGWSDAHGQPVAANSGKRLRPLLCMLCYDAARGEREQESPGRWRSAVPAAAAVELVHNFSLIHDDIEDKSIERHGRPTVWKVWGTAQAINAGDAMFVLARRALDRLAALVDPKTYADVHLMFDVATLALTQGQFLDLFFESRDVVTVDDYLQMVQGKTCALLAASAQIGARIATDDANILACFTRFGENLGVAFQIADDILGIWGDPAVTGKPARDDILAKKKSLPLLAAIQQDETGEIAAYFQRETVSASEVEGVAAILDQVNAREGAERMAEAYVNRAHAALKDSGLSGPEIEHLHALAGSSVRRLK